MRTPSLSGALVFGALLAACSSSAIESKYDSVDPDSSSGGVGGRNTTDTGGNGGSFRSGGSTGTGGNTAPDGSTGTGGTTALDAGASAPDAASTTTDASAARDGGNTITEGNGSFPGCPRCVPLFDGKSLAGWKAFYEKFEVAMDDRLNKPVIRSVGKARGFLATDKEYQNFRLIYSNRLLSEGHVQNMLIWCMRSAKGTYPNDACGGIQYQPPTRGMWDYRPGQDKTPAGKMAIGTSDASMMDWSQCEMLVKGTTGELRVACCKLTPGQGPCKGIEVERWKDTVSMGNLKGPIAWQTHNPNHIIHWTDVHIEEDPTVDDLITTK